VDSVVLCYEIGKMSREALLRAKTQLESVESNIAGIVLNQIKLQTQGMESYPYYQNYKYGYGYGYYGHDESEQESEAG
jgi:Mrp family chromosome partitioning ATPase